MTTFITPVQRTILHRLSLAAFPIPSHEIRPAGAQTVYEVVMALDGLENNGLVEKINGFAFSFFGTVPLSVYKITRFGSDFLTTH